MIIIILFTHNDLDAIACKILIELSKLKGCSIELCSNMAFDRKIKKFLKDTKNKNRKIFITDITPSTQEVVNLLNEVHTSNRNEVILIDHHASEDYLNKFSWATITSYDEEKNQKTSATTLFYDYLIKQNLIEKTNFIDEFTELVRLYDTWDWKEKEVIEAKQLNDLFYILGVSKFEESILEKSKSQNFFFDNFEKTILELEENKINKYINTKEMQLKTVWYKNFKVGIVFAEQYFSELANDINIRHPYLDFIFIINYSNKSVSIRTIHDNIDVSKIAEMFEGGGHMKSSGAKLNDNFHNEFILPTFNKKNVKRDFLDNKHNLKGNDLVLYKDKYDEFVSIYKNNNKWHVYKNSINLFSNLETFEQAENLLKKSLDAYVQKDDYYYKYISKKYGYKEATVRSNYDRIIKEIKEKTTLL